MFVESERLRVLSDQPLRLLDPSVLGYQQFPIQLSSKLSGELPE